MASASVSAPGTIAHMVWFQFKEEVSDEAVRAIMTSLMALKTHIPQILDIVGGKNFCPRSNGCTHGIIVYFANKEDLQAYQVHEEHQKVVAEIRKATQATFAMDFPVGDY